VVVTDIWPGGSAALAGIAPGDVILSVNGEPIDEEAGLTYRVATHRVGDALALQIRRGSQNKDIHVALSGPPNLPAADQRTISGRNPLAGATVVNVSPATAQQYGVDPFVSKGVLVAQIEGGAAQSIGVQTGDFIREVNGQKIATTSQLAAAVQAPSRSWVLTIERGGQVITARFGA
jgi:S1-C subfamily serine protease